MCVRVRVHVRVCVCERDRERERERESKKKRHEMTAIEKTRLHIVESSSTVSAIMPAHPLICER